MLLLVSDISFLASLMGNTMFIFNLKLTSVFTISGKCVGIAVRRDRFWF